jgi:CRISPR/Cas system CSM-associated protein Csm3 (group 7 of RAMP superfamily)
MLTLNVEMTSRWHVGTGEGGPSTDALTFRLGGRPAIPLSQLKDVLRDHAEALARPLGLPPEVVTAVFGGPGGGGLQGEWEWTSATTEEALAASPSRHHHRDPARGIVPPDGLFDLEVVAPGTLTAVVGPRDEVAADPSHVVLVGLSAATVRRLGGRRNRGLGRCHITPCWSGPVREAEGGWKEQNWDLAGLIAQLPTVDGQAS